MRKNNNYLNSKIKKAKFAFYSLEEPEIETKALLMISKYSTIEPHPWP
jgi:hypothetical protein